MNLDASQQHLEMEKSLELVGAEYDDLKGIYVAAKENLKGLGERFYFLGARVNEIY